MVCCAVRCIAASWAQFVLATRPYFLNMHGNTRVSCCITAAGRKSVPAFKLYTIPFQLIILLISKSFNFFFFNLIGYPQVLISECSSLKIRLFLGLIILVYTVNGGGGGVRFPYGYREKCEKLLVSKVKKKKLLKFCYWLFTGSNKKN